LLFFGLPSVLARPDPIFPHSFYGHDNSDNETAHCLDRMERRRLVARGYDQDRHWLFATSQDRGVCPDTLPRVPLQFEHGTVSIPASCRTVRFADRKFVAAD
jgi:hypothetical protein